MNDIEKSETFAKAKRIEEDVHEVEREMEALRQTRVSAVFDKHFENLPPTVKAVATKALAAADTPEKVFAIKSETLAGAIMFLVLNEVGDRLNKGGCGNPNCDCAIERDVKDLVGDPN